MRSNTTETYLGVKSETLTWPGRFFVFARLGALVSPRILIPNDQEFGV